MEQEIENVLRAVPKPAPPAGLKEQLVAQVRLPSVQPAAQTLAGPMAPANWLRRWWPVLAPVAATLACAVGLTVQQVEIHSLKQAIRDLSRDAGANAPAPSVPAAGTNDTPSGADAATPTQQEISRLKELASQLATEVAQLEQMRAENVKLRTQLAEPPAGFLTPEETDALAKAKEKAESINCINNLKQMGLSVRTWAIDNADVSPPDMLSMSNELSTPKILVCPADHGRQRADSFAAYTSANCSYEYLAPSAPETEPSRVLFRCPFHGHVCLSDGSVQAYVGKQHPEQLVQRNGKLYLETSAQPAQGVPASQTNDPQQTFRRRYGLEGPGGTAPTPPPAAEPPSSPDGSNP
jgi:regulator of replication initiation timing